MRIFITLILFVCLSTTVCSQVYSHPSTAFYYADSIPVDEISQFDQIVVDPGHVSDEEIKKLKQYGGKVIAYVSVGESERWRNDYSTIDKEIFIGVNKGWDSDIVDLSKPQWTQFLMVQRFEKLVQRNFDGFFLDTLDSYQAVLKKNEWHIQEQGLIKIIKGIAQKYPDTRILLNRGFPVLGEVHDIVHGVIAESLFARWDPIDKEYGDVKNADREWLLNKLNVVKDKYNLPVTVIDYMPPAQRNAARKVAKKIAKLGFSPWVSTAELNYLGIGKIEILPRKILMMYNSTNQHLNDIYSASIHTAAAMPIEYLGYVPIYYDINGQLPKQIIKGRYAGVITWFDGDVGNVNYRDWLLKQLNDDVKVAVMGRFGFDIDDEILNKMNLKRIDEKIRHLKLIKYYDDFLGFESKPLIGKIPEEFFKSNKKSSNKVHLKIKYGNKSRQVLEPVVTGAWGGFAQAPWIRDKQTKGYNYWILDPFKFFKTALNLRDVPMPDVTTENGRRIWMAHIDGDGFLNRAEMLGTPYSSEVIKEEILERYSEYPHTISVIEGEVGKLGLYPKQSAKLEKIAQEIFKLPNVKPASHTYSHPFQWINIKKNQQSGDGYNIAIKNYRFSFEREVLGSIDYINKKLLTGNNKAKVFLWSGDALPTIEPLKYCEENNLINFNGGATTIRKDRASILFVSPMVRTVGKYIQVYAPIMNENVYTNDWTGPYYGYQRVTETFEMTDKPRRLKALDIYYHFYSGSKPAAITALHKAYSWTMKKDIFPVYISEYAQKILEFRKIVAAIGLDNTLYYSGFHHLRSLRSFNKNSWPSVANSHNVNGYRDLHDGRYISLGDNLRTQLKVTPEKTDDIYLIQTNGRVNKWNIENKKITFSISSHIPIMLEIASREKTCKLYNVKNKSKKTNLGWKFKLIQKEISNATIYCQ